ncbi:MAG: cysteine--tRNA ligase [Candidatus Woesearchaeota archaeon]|nr:cysteine--tRNA ligase [Nanoarchaeota archaeon]USN44391.1 MAG: cysteine--tRNA ligase [Candidatus Woesearchaeota archaeon]
MLKSIYFYNTKTRKKEEFKEKETGIVKIYTCGPTVYSTQHIGNMRAAITADILHRTLEYFKYTVIDVINITDVGHLTDDDHDAGEDKMLKAARKEKKGPYEIARYYEEKYIADTKKLHIKGPKYRPRATEHIKEQIEMIKLLEERGHTYRTSDGLYFDTSTFKEYGALSGQKQEDKKAGARVKLDSEKRNPSDFALWKFLTGENEHHIMKWDSPWGIGFPGWHIECSAMSHKYLGSEFDIHMGGIEHIPVHHENEIAQNVCSGAISGISFWMHYQHMMIDKNKMSKSLGNVYSLEDLEKKSYSPLALRELCLRTHYRKTMNFTFDALDAAQTNVKKLNEFKKRIEEIKVTENADETVRKLFNTYLDKFEQAMKDDLNTALALAAVDEFITEINRKRIFSEQDKETVLEFLRRTDKVLALLEEEERIPSEVEKLAREREVAREKKEFGEADKLRDEIKGRGYDVKDDKSSKLGYRLTKI